VNSTFKSILSTVVALACVGAFGFAVNVSNDVASLKASAAADSARLERLESKVDQLGSREYSKK